MDNNDFIIKKFYWLPKYTKSGEKIQCGNCKHFMHENGETCGVEGMLCGSWEEAEEYQTRLEL